MAGGVDAVHGEGRGHEMTFSPTADIFALLLISVVVGGGGMAIGSMLYPITGRKGWLK